MVMGNAKVVACQVYWNLLENALKFRDPQRRPLIRVALAPSDAAWVRPTMIGSMCWFQTTAWDSLRTSSEAVFEAFCRLNPREDCTGHGPGSVVLPQDRGGSRRQIHRRKHARRGQHVPRGVAATCVA